MCPFQKCRSIWSNVFTYFAQKSLPEFSYIPYCIFNRTETAFIQNSGYMHINQVTEVRSKLHLMKFTYSCFKTHECISQVEEIQNLKIQTVKVFKAEMSILDYNFTGALLCNRRNQNVECIPYSWDKRKPPDCLKLWFQQRLFNL